MSGPLRNVVAIVFDGVAPFELGVLCEAFGIDRADMGLPNFDFTICTPTPGRVRTSLGFELDIHDGLEVVDRADLVAVPAMSGGHPVPAEVCEALRAAHDRGARILAVCSGAFVLGAAGLLDGRRCTTHWMHAADLQETFPEAKVDPDVLYVEDGQVVTSAGTAAGIDACLHIVRQEFGSRVAAMFARRMVVPPHRDGGQAQYVESPIPDCSADTLEPMLTWMLSHLDESMTVETLAARALLSPRTFARRFRAETGTTPYHWLVAQRVILAERLLEETDEPVERVATLSGLGNAASLRHHFSRVRGITPQAYRRTFRRGTDRDDLGQHDSAGADERMLA